jgi:hypothetical protein
MRGHSRVTGRGDDTMNKSGKAMKLMSAMDDADFVLVNGVMFQTEYLRVPDKYTVADDIVLEAKNGDTEIAFTRDEMEGAEAIGDGAYRLKSGALLRFLSGATLH